MKLTAHGSTALVAGLAGLALSACGGGGGSPPPAPAPPPPPPAGIALTSANYQSALRLSVGQSISAFSNARVGVILVDSQVAVPPNIVRFPCPVSGTNSSSFTDRNSNGLVDAGDSAQIQWEECNSGGATIDGLLRIDVVNVVLQAPDTHELSLSVSTTGLEITPVNVPAAGAITHIFTIPIRYTRTTTSDRFVISSASFSSRHAIGVDALDRLSLDLAQDYAANTYSYSMSGRIDSDVLGGEFQFATPQPFTGVIGEYPSAGRLVVSGSGNSAARLSEEGSALTNPNTLLAAVDSNGDGTDDTVEPELQWSLVAPLLIFDSFRNQIVVGAP
jgi:hypothetical protein